MVSQAERTSAWYKGMQKLKHGIFSEIDVAFLAKVVKYDKKNHVADILPLANLSDGQKSAQYLDVPVAKSCYLIDELVEKFKGDLETADSNSGAKEHSRTDFVGKLPKKIFKPGAIVIAVALDRDTDNFDGENTFNPSGRMHDANDSIIIGVL